MPGMTAEPTEVRILDIPLLDARELTSSLPAESFRIEREALSPGEHGDFGITAAIVVTIGPAVILAIAAWLQKRRQREVIEVEVQNTLPDGSVERRRVRIERSESEPNAKAIEQLVAGLKPQGKLALRFIGLDE